VTIGRRRFLGRGPQEWAIRLFLFGILVSQCDAQIGVPPVIAVPPLNQTVSNQGTATFSVTAVSLTTLQYRWFHDGSLIPDATDRTYTISNVQWTDEGTYAVEVRNASGRVMSSDATLTLINPPLHFDSAAVLDGGLRMEVSGPSASSYVLLASTNLSEWFPISTNSGSSGNAVFVEPAGSPFTFYAAMIPVTPTRLMQNTSGGQKMEIKAGKKGAQSFRQGFPGGAPYTVGKIVLHLSRESQSPNTNFVFSIGTGINSGPIEKSIMIISPTVITNISGGNSFQTYEINYPTPVGPLTAGTTYYLNMECEASNGKSIFSEYSESDAYANGTYYKSGVDDGEDIWFQIWGWK
jgi:hypothetical protein